RLLLLLGLLASGCVRYTHQPVALDEVAQEVAARDPGLVDYEAALSFARQHNPDLRRLRAEAAAAGFDVPPTNIVLTVNTLESKVPGFVDPVALLKLGPRGARAQAAKERESALLQELQDRDLDVAAGIAEAFVVERVLRDFRIPALDVDPELFERAGLASAVDRQRVSYAIAKKEAEDVTIEALRAENFAGLRVLLGVRSSANLSVELPEGDFPPLPVDGDLMIRPDLAVALARYRVADREFRAAVLDQYPVIAVGPVFNWDVLRWGVFLPARIPVGAAGPAKAAGKRREAARIAVEAALLRAEEDGTRSRHRFERTNAQAKAAKIGARTSAADLKSALVHLEVTPDAFGHLSSAAPEAIERLAKARSAKLEAARARVAYARAYAWPHSGEEQR
ncbi:MAG: TolC family protein, partial [Planctomycetota bacterium]